MIVFCFLPKSVINASNGDIFYLRLDLHAQWGAYDCVMR